MPGIVSATGLFHDWFLVGETPHISARTASLARHNYILSTLHLSFVSSSGAASERRGYCDSVVRNGTSCTGSVRTEYVLILSVLPVPSVLLVYLSLIPPGISGSAITGYSHIFDIYVIQCCTSTRHPTSHIHHSYLYKLIKPLLLVTPQRQAILRDLLGSV